MVKVFVAVIITFCDEGYWRKQMEHICGHLKVHAADYANFRALVAEPRLGKVRNVSHFLLYFSIVILKLYNSDMWSCLVYFIGCVCRDNVQHHTVDLCLLVQAEVISVTIDSYFTFL